MAQKRMRVFAGPNGSGKTTVLKRALEENNISLGVYINADDIEQTLRNGNRLALSDFGLVLDSDTARTFFRHSTFSPKKRNEPDLWQRIAVRENALYIETQVDSYLSADIAELLRQQLLAKGLSFTYETVMSHAGKIDFFGKAKESGYKVYLYFVATEDPDINISRVEARVAQHGHAVAPQTIKDRYYKSLQNLKNAVKQTDRAYIWDNSSVSLLIAEITNGAAVEMADTDKVPAWFVQYLMTAA